MDYLTYRWTTWYNINVDLAHYDNVHDKVVKGGIKLVITRF